jgi:hypothetical protein
VTISLNMAGGTVRRKNINETYNKIYYTLSSLISQVMHFLFFVKGYKLKGNLILEYKLNVGYKTEFCQLQL